MPNGWISYTLIGVLVVALYWQLLTRTGSDNTRREIEEHCRAFRGHGRIVIWLILWLVWPLAVIVFAVGLVVAGALALDALRMDVEIRWRRRRSQRTVERIQANLDQYGDRFPAWVMVVRDRHGDQPRCTGCGAFRTDRPCSRCGSKRPPHAMRYPEPTR